MTISELVVFADGIIHQIGESLQHGAVRQGAAVATRAGGIASFFLVLAASQTEAQNSKFTVILVDVTWGTKKY